MKMPLSLLALLVVLATLARSSASGAQGQDPGTPAQREAGNILYDKYCSQCHGLTGDGKGYAAPYLKPPPRNFTAGQFKIRTTPSGALPTQEDIRRVIRQGMPYTTMIGWSNFTDKEVDEIIYYIKTFSANFEDPEYYDPPVDIPSPPAFSDASSKLGREIYLQMECHSCHGDKGRADGSSAPTLEDEAGRSIHPADLTQRWTFRGGPTRTDLYRTFSTGLNGTPMPSYADSLTIEERWHLVDYVYSLGLDDEPNYSERLISKSIDGGVSISEGETLFKGAESAYFPLVGQIMEPGRAFHPATNRIEVKAVHNREDLAFLLKWHDMRADVSGKNHPALETQPSEGESEAAQEEGPSEESPVTPDDPFGDMVEEEGVSEEEQTTAEDFFSDVVEEAGAAEEEQTTADDFFADFEEEDDAAEDFFAVDETEEEQVVGQSEFSDAVAIQFPSVSPEGIRLPYFIFGDLENSVDIWYADLAQEQPQCFVGRGSRSLTDGDAGDLEMNATFQGGEWTVIFKRKRRSENGISMENDQWYPIAFSVWDGRREERGNQRALTSWYYVYIEPAETASPVFPMIRVALITLGIEVILIALMRRKYKNGLQLPVLQTDT